MTKFSHIMLHHSLTKDSGTVSWDAIRRFHTVNEGWDDIGYHGGIELIGDAMEILIGRPWNMPGAHCWQAGMNKKAFGFMFCGNYDEVAPPRVMLIKACKYIIKPIKEIYGISNENIIGHSTYAPKTCPGKKFDMGVFFDILNHI